MRPTAFFLYAFFVWALLFSGLAHAENARIDMGRFAHLPVLYEGRVQPLDSFARTQAFRISGSERPGGRTAASWLARAVFLPETAMTDPVFHVPGILKDRLGLNRAQTLFSLADLQDGLRKTEPQVEPLLKTASFSLTGEQAALLALHENARTFLQLLRSFSLFLPLDVRIPAAYRERTGERPYTYEGLSIVAPALEKDLKTVIAQKGENPESYTEEEKSLALLAYNLDTLRAGGVGNDLLRVIPSSWEGGLWISPWGLFNRGQGSPATSEYLKAWKNMATAYRSDDPIAWNMAVDAALELSKPWSPPVKRTIEVLYNIAKPLYLAMGFYALALLAGAVPASSRFTVLLAAGGLISHIAAVAARIYIMERPPVGTLYESVLFVALICALAGAGNAKASLRLGGLGCALGLLGIAPFLSQGEQMDVLVAVLNTNFWLTIHVLCITAGYAVCLFSAAAAHAWMVAQVRKTSQAAEDLYPVVHLSSLAALALMVTGTLLGGVWADQSWGRFWGWDPKENGALLIILWIIWLQHGRIAGFLRPPGFTAAVATLGIVVALSWFGVNLLGTGLHSYGFTTGVAGGLAAFCLAEAVIIGALWVLIRRKERHEKSAS